MTSAFSWQNSVSLCSALFCIPRSNLPITPGISWLPNFAFQFLMMKRTPFFGQFQKVLQVLIEPLNFSFFDVSGWGIVLDYCAIEWFALEMNRDHSVIFCVILCNFVILSILKQQQKNAQSCFHYALQSFFFNHKESQILCKGIIDLMQISDSQTLGLNRPLKFQNNSNNS